MTYLQYIDNLAYYTSVILVGGYFTHGICKKIAPQKTTQIVTRISWKCLRYYSKAQLWVGQNIYPTYTTLTSLLNTQRKDKIMIIHKGKCIAKFKDYDFIERETNNINNFDFILHRLNNNIPNYVVRNNILEPIKVDLVKTSNVRFLSIILTVESDVATFEIHLHHPNNFYLVDNIILDRNFLTWYCYNNYNYVLDDQAKYNVSLLDHNIKLVTLKSNEAILLSDKNYSVLETMNEGDCSLEHSSPSEDDIQSIEDSESPPPSPASAPSPNLSIPDSYFRSLVKYITG
jgi:hypothetical protein